MDIRRVLMGEPVKAASARPVKQAEEKKTGTARPSTDRLELSRQWVENMEEQRARAQAALLAGGLLYTVGGVLYAVKWPGRNNPRFGCHEIFHVFILLGSIAHFMLMYRVVAMM